MASVLETGGLEMAPVSSPARSEIPRGLPQAGGRGREWLLLGLIVYGITDKRGSAVIATRKFAGDPIGRMIAWDGSVFECWPCLDKKTGGIVFTPQMDSATSRRCPR